jgi:hypothetical protein
MGRRPSAEGGTNGSQTLRRREPDSNHRSRSKRNVGFRNVPQGGRLYRLGAPFAQMGSNRIVIGTFIGQQHSDALQ